MLWQGISSWEWMLRCQWNWKNLRSTQRWLTVYLFYWFTLIKILSCSFTLTAISDTPNFHFCPILCLSLCQSSALFFSLSDSPLYTHLLFIHINILMLWWDGVIVINWLKINGCFTWGTAHNNVNNYNYKNCVN